MVEVYEYQGKMMTIAQLAALSPHNINPSALRYRIKYKHMAVHDAMMMPVREKKKKFKGLSCGAVHPLDCLNCKYAVCICMGEPAMPGESMGDYVFQDYGRR